MKTFAERRSIRKYSQRPVPGELIESLAAGASRAATMGNMQLYSLVVTTDLDTKSRLADAHHRQPMVVEAPAVLTFCADFNRFARWCECRDAVPGYGNFVSFFNATTVDNPGDIIGILGLPRLVFPVLTVALGYPDEHPEQTDRLPVEGIIHHDRYKDYSAGDIDRIYAAKEALPESRYFVELNGTDNLAQVFTRFRFTEVDNLAMSEKMTAALKKQGF